MMGLHDLNILVGNILANVWGELSFNHLIDLIITVVAHLLKRILVMSNRVQAVRRRIKALA